MSYTEYWGLQSIATRLSLNRPGTALEWYRRYSLLLCLDAGAVTRVRFGTRMKACYRSGSWPLSKSNGRSYLRNPSDKSGAALSRADRKRNCTGMGA